MQRNCYRYLLESIDFDGASTFDGPVQAAVGTIRLISPESGVSSCRSALPYFGWESTPDDRFKIQLVTSADFTTKAFTLAASEKDGWLRGLSYTPTAAEWKRVKSILGKGKTLYWRVSGKNLYGCPLT